MGCCARCGGLLLTTAHTCFESTGGYAPVSTPKAGPGEERPPCPCGIDGCTNGMVAGVVLGTASEVSALKAQLAEAREAMANALDLMMQGKNAKTWGQTKAAADLRAVLAKLEGR